MRIYLTTQGAQLIKEGRHILVKKGNDIYRTLFVEKIEQLCLFGNIEITASARNLLLFHGVDTVFLMKDGRYRGRFEQPGAKNIFLRIKQFELLNNHNFAIRFSKDIVTGKLKNMMTLLRRMKRTQKNQKAGNQAGEIKKLLTKIEQADNINTIRGYEGAGSAAYFSVFGEGFKTDIGFRRRVRRPPTDPINSVLSLLYTFLFNRVYAAIKINYLEPYLGFLHTPDYGRASLALDLMEEFRVIIVDSLTLALFNLGILKQSDFIFQKLKITEPKIDDKKIDITSDPFGLYGDNESNGSFELPNQRIADHPSQKQDNISGKLPVRLTSEAMARVIENFERKMSTEFYYQPYDRKITYSEALIAQAGEYRKVVEGKLKIYEPLLLK